MPKSPSNFIWYDLMTTDMDAAEAFYRAVVGWEAQDSGATHMRYTRFTANGRMVAGLMAIPPGAGDMGVQPSWNGYIYADDVDATAKAIKDAGGRVYREPEDIPDIGRFAVVADPQGAAFNIFKPSGEGEGSDQMAPGHIGWHELYADNWENAFDFYSKLFGWAKADAVDMGPMGTYQLFHAGGNAIGGMMSRQPGMPGPLWQYYFNVDAIDAAMARFKANGGQVIEEPMEVPGPAWIIQCVDPQGAMFALVAMTR